MSSEIESLSLEIQEKLKVLGTPGIFIYQTGNNINFNYMNMGPGASIDMLLAVKKKLEEALK